MGFEFMQAQQNSDMYTAMQNYLEEQRNVKDAEVLYQGQDMSKLIKAYIEENIDDKLNNQNY